MANRCQVSALTCARNPFRRVALSAMPATCSGAGQLRDGSTKAPENAMTSVRCSAESTASASLQEGNVLWCTPLAVFSVYMRHIDLVGMCALHQSRESHHKTLRSLLVVVVSRETHVQDGRRRRVCATTPWEQRGSSSRVRCRENIASQFGSSGNMSLVFHDPGTPCSRLPCVQARC